MTPDREAVVEVIASTRLVAIVRASTGEQAADVARTLLDAGVAALEVSLTTPDALAVVGALAAQATPGQVIGAGTIVSTADAEAALHAGARFLVSPAFDPDVLAAAAQGGAASIPGCYTPTEVVSATRHGADLIKLFPASSAGIGHLRAMRQALPAVRFVPTGGVAIDTSIDWLRAGAAAVAVGSTLTAGPLEAVRRRAGELLDRIAAG